MVKLDDIFKKAFLETIAKDNLPHKLVTIIDADGLAVRESFADVLDATMIETPIPDGLYEPKWDGTAWIEGGSAPVVEVPKTVEERMEDLERENLLGMMAITEMYEILAGGMV